MNRFLRTAQRGAALLLAMLTVTLAATLAAAALWRQWRSVEVLTAERSRVQSGWMLVAAQDWARLILREDARASQVDHLDEPWAVPLQESRLSSFLAADASGTVNADALAEADAVFLSGQVTDLQSRLNVYNLAPEGQLQPTVLKQFQRLFTQLGLAQGELTRLTDQLVLAQTKASDAATAPLVPQKFAQLSWLGLSPATLATLEPYATLLAQTTTVNLNTASAEVLQASAADLDRAGAQRIVDARRNRHFNSVAEANQLLGSTVFTTSDQGVVSNFFEARGRLRLNGTAVEERALLQRDAGRVRTVWRERGALTNMAAAAP